MDKNKGKKFNEKLMNNKDMPKIVTLDQQASRKWGGSKMVIAPPLDYDEIIKKIPKGKIITIDLIIKSIAKKYNADITCPLTCGIFINIVAWASYERTDNITPFWRVLKTNGELNEKFPESILLQKRQLELEGHIVYTKGKKKLKYYVKDFEKCIFDLD